MTTPVRLGDPLTLEDLEDVAYARRAVVFQGDAREAVRRSRAAIDQLCAAGDDGPAVYGVNTGFGALAETRISASQVRELQRNLLVSHATGVGAPLAIAEVRAMMLLRAQVLSLGHSGVRVELVDKLLELLAANVHPWIPSQGSVGASGDLAPLAHLALVLIGEGDVLGEDGRRGDARVALERAGIEPLTLEAKEGLSLINGTQYIVALGSLALLRAERLAKIADVAGAMSLEANQGTRVPFAEKLHAIRPHPGQRLVAANLWRLLDDSEIARSHADCGRVQDAYSFRCMPQIHGASRDVFVFARAVLERELNSVTDNPSVFVEDGETEVLSGGNFHGQPLGFALDAACMAVAELANVSERRVEQLVNPQLSSGLTPFLAKPGGLHSGFMIAQVAAASLVSENKVLAHPASVDSIPSSAGREDHVSMASVSAKKLRDVVANVEKSMAIELMVAAQGVEQRRPLRAARGVEAAHAAVREHVAPLDGDRILYRDIAAIEDALITRGGLLAQVEATLGALA